VLSIRKTGGTSIHCHGGGIIFAKEDEDEDQQPVVLKDITEQKRAEEQIRPRITQLTALDQASATVASHLNLEEIFGAVVQGLWKGFGYRLICIYLIKETVLELKAHAGYSSPLDPSIVHVPLEQGVVGRTARTGEPQLVTNVQEDADFFSSEQGITSEAVSK